MLIALLLSLIVAVYNNVVNLWGPFQRGAYVPVNLAFAGLITGIAATTLELSPSELGLEGDLVDAALPLVAVGAFAVGMFALVHSRHAHRIADRRVRGLRGPELAYHVAVRIPLGTAVVEEVIFRGVLLAAWRAAGTSTLVASMCSSIVFGLWHILPTIIGIRMNDSHAGARKLGLGITGAVLLTTVAGLSLTWLRLETESLIAPIVIHGGINSVAAFAAVRAGRREEVEERSGVR